MRSRRAATRFALRRLVRKGQLDRAQAKAILSDEDATELVADFVTEQMAADELFASEDGPIIAFIKWLMENQDAVIAFIQALIALFDTE